MDTTFIWELLVNGVILGSSYALLAAGLAVIFGVLNVVNFAHGALYMLGAFAAYFLIPHSGYWVGLLLSAGIMAALGAALHGGLLRRLPPDGAFSRSLLLTLGLAMIIQNGAIMLWGAGPRQLAEDARPQGHIVLAGATIPSVRALVVVVAAVTLGALYLFLNRTQMGRAMRGVSQNPTAALVVGISPTRVGRLAMALGVGLAGLAGATLAPVFTVSPQMGITIVFKVFAIVVIGGLGSVPGAVIVAFGVGVLESFAGGYGTAMTQSVSVFLFMIVIMLVRPQGLFSKEVRV
ncbi:branched-chain amino acid ABC transporter permease [Actinomadura mexicana]|uniref:Amino acid/amide ABC transporter membrane protein 1, HAAT family n=1 Tax=Actinomadura mexicana TaxID=134959 RepID=A0A238XAV4_9ACTN|nr:branched-chain amino acid ABC transporter permease [Actinomadura mexicana]SNR56185.1 amino acid/amide ABC transporter membrane protein 1, HAAT family [Actinomadura mexicana]